ncbi:Cytosol aminopeptidase, catalytic domain [Parelaphostrongylus tenuis]|uniref:Cytosol aminopeptidase, catalytic domain n=1 Tax=Parelaphostrongylus tenuis TaxID=148309 RepID=A0AAD5R3P3_PARTN|nr:Cytosol aminopeptidase, catalytic domain [Parelaphostrongylus tenuis]
MQDPVQDLAAGLATKRSTVVGYQSRRGDGVVPTLADTPTYDGVILVTNCGKIVAETPKLKEVSAAIMDFIEVHRGALTSANIIPVDKKIIPSGRLILAGTGPVTRDIDDVRRFPHSGEKWRSVSSIGWNQVTVIGNGTTSKISSSRTGVCSWCSSSTLHTSERS